MTDGAPPTAARGSQRPSSAKLGRELQIDRREKTRNIEAALAFDADRLERKRVAGAADQCVGANTRTNGRSGGCPV